MFALLKNIGATELVIIVLVIGGLFGGNKFKQLAERLGESAKELKNVKHELDNVKSDVAEVIGGVK